MSKVECGEVRRVFFNPVNNVLYLEVRGGVVRGLIILLKWVMG